MYVTCRTEKSEVLGFNQWLPPLRKGSHQAWLAEHKKHGVFVTLHWSHLKIFRQGVGPPVDVFLSHWQPLTGRVARRRDCGCGGDNAHAVTTNPLLVTAAISSYSKIFRGQAAASRVLYCTALAALYCT
jgi:hypothetical protein